MHFEKEAIRAERSGNSPDRRDEIEIEDGRFGDDDFDADVGDSDAPFGVEGGRGGVFPTGIGEAAPGLEFGAWASEEYLEGVDPESVLGGLPLEDMDDSVIKDYEEAIELGAATGGPEGGASQPMGFEKEEIEELEARLSAALSGPCPDDFIPIPILINTPQPSRMHASVWVRVGRAPRAQRARSPCVQVRETRLRTRITSWVPPWRGVGG